MNLIKSIISFGAVLFFSNVCHAQLGQAPMPKIEKATGPSLEKTTQWITEKIASLPTRKEFGTGNVRQLASFGDCDVTAYELKNEEAPTSGLGRGWPSVERQFVLLRDIDENDIRNYGTSLHLPTIGEKNVVKAHSLSKVIFEDKDILNKFPLNSDDLFTPYPEVFKSFNIGGREVSARRWLQTAMFINVPDRETGLSLTNAFKHAIKLCRDKAAHENASKPAKPKDLF